MNSGEQLSIRTTRSRPGFTIVELLAAMVLAVLLIAAVLSVLRTVTSRTGIAVRESSHETWHARLQKQLAWDLTNSRTIRPIENGFELSGFAGRDFVSRTAIHCRAIIRYSVAEAAGRFCLMRSEEHPDALNLDNHTQDLVCLNVNGIVVGAAAGQHPSPDGNGVQVLAPDSDLPDQLHVEFYEPSSNSAVFSHDFALR